MAERRGGRGGASELVGGARGGRRRLLWRTAAMGASGEREREREQGEKHGREGGIRPGDRGGTEKKRRGVALAG